MAKLDIKEPILITQYRENRVYIESQQKVLNQSLEKISENFGHALEGQLVKMRDYPDIEPNNILQMEIESIKLRVTNQDCGIELKADCIVELCNKYNCFQFCTEFVAMLNELRYWHLVSLACLLKVR
jgi:hypothetical protein